MQQCRRVRVRSRRAVVGGAVLALISLTLAPAAQSATPEPAIGGLSRTAAVAEITFYDYGTFGFFDGDLGIWVDAPSSAPFEVRQTRRYGNPAHLDLVRRSGAAATLERLPDSLVGRFGAGLQDFFDIEVTLPDGTVIVRDQVDFCPNNLAHARVHRSSPTDPIYPDECNGSVWAAGDVMGIERGWTTPAIDLGLVRGLIEQEHEFVDDRYRVDVSIAAPWRSALSISDAASASTSVEMHVTTVPVTCEPFCPIDNSAARGRRAVPARPVGIHTTNSTSSRRSPSKAAQATGIPASAVPDLAALPAWGIATQNVTLADGTSADILGFGATVWNAGPGQLVVEGFRRPNDAVMDSFQYFYQGGVPSATRYVGQMEYDPRVGHRHWHFRDFAVYELTGEDRAAVQRSGKEAFCLAPTDAIDLTRPHATYRPESVGLGSACGNSASRWIREVLPSGWGDTYTQMVAGQAFDVTTLPNGVYYIKVTANPLQRLIERSAQNNVSFRRIRLGGRSGARTVTVVPWRGIDTEGSDGSSGGGTVNH